MNRLVISTFIVVILAAALRPASAGMSMAQIKSSLKMVRNSCQSKSGAAMDVVEGIQKGEFPDDNNLKCYAKCALGMMQSMKNGKFKPDPAIAQIKALMSDDVKDRLIASFEKCRNSADGIDDACEAGFAVMKCLYNADPECFFFP
ncbi:general odorant-binding protein 72-like [Periplaneta americana]|uniref:general odorant-binding protein 72-like n=1 Tax=Periplaneta americana TaxID=6978 RepID=UPI0037E8D651